MARNPKPARKDWKELQAWMRRNGWRDAARSRLQGRYNPNLMAVKRVERTPDGFRAHYGLLTPYRVRIAAVPGPNKDRPQGDKE